MKNGIVSDPNINDSEPCLKETHISIHIILSL